MERYISYKELTAFLRKSRREALNSHSLASSLPVKNATDAQQRLHDLQTCEAEYHTLSDVMYWAEEHCISGDLILPTMPDGVFKKAKE